MHMAPFCLLDLDTADSMSFLCCSVTSTAYGFHCLTCTPGYEPWSNSGNICVWLAGDDVDLAAPLALTKATRVCHARSAAGAAWRPGKLPEAHGLPQNLEGHMQVCCKTLTVTIQNCGFMHSGQVAAFACTWLASVADNTTLLMSRSVCYVVPSKHAVACCHWTCAVDSPSVRPLRTSDTQALSSVIYAS